MSMKINVTIPVPSSGQFWFRCDVLQNGTMLHYVTLH